MKERGFLQGNQDIVADTGAQKLFSTLSVLVFAVAATMCYVAVGFVGWQKTMPISGSKGLDMRIGLNNFAIDFTESQAQLMKDKFPMALLAEGKRATFTLPLPTDCTQFKNVTDPEATDPKLMMIDLETECNEWKSGRIATMVLAILGGVTFTLATLLAYCGRTGSYKNGTRVSMFVAILAAVIGTTAGIVYSLTRQKKDPKVMMLTQDIVMKVQQMLMTIIPDIDLTALKMAPFGYHKSMFLVCLTSFVIPYSLIGICCGFTNAMK